MPVSGSLIRASMKGEEPGCFLHGCSQLLPELICQVMLLVLLLTSSLILIPDLISLEPRLIAHGHLSSKHVFIFAYNPIKGLMT